MFRRAQTQQEAVVEIETAEATEAVIILQVAEIAMISIANFATQSGLVIPQKPKIEVTH